MTDRTVTLTLKELDDLLDSIIHTDQSTDVEGSGEGSDCGACYGFGYGVIEHSPTCLWFKLRKQYFPDHWSLKFATVAKR